MSLIRENNDQYGYICIHKGKRIEIYQVSKYDAQIEAQKYFKAKKSYDVDVYLCEGKDGEQKYQSIN